jgi:hypothetical protein
VPRAEEPASPEQELVASLRPGYRCAPKQVLTMELALFCQSGVSIVIASCGQGGEPVVGRGLACRLDEPDRVRIVLRGSSNTALFRAVREGSGLAVTFTKPTTHRSIQLKARAARVSATAAEDNPAAKSQTADFSADLVACGYSEEFSRAYCAFAQDDLAAVDFIPEHAFVQTPGPGAGGALAP